ncbi:MAG: PIN domain-containing protein, partial [Methylobacteriaceae bacterium]|nr:PIN domain-containing protein [Methylobacteriaceae bacterium]
MTADGMVDTNVVVYAASRLAEDRPKTEIARSLLLQPGIGLSAQVLQEFIVVTTRKVRSPWSLDQALDWVETLEDYPCLPVDGALVRYGAELALRHQISYWDAAILAAAHRLNASTLYTEDLSHGQAYGSVRVVNPFLS